MKKKRVTGELVTVYRLLPRSIQEPTMSWHISAKCHEEEWCAVQLMHAGGKLIQQTIDPAKGIDMRWCARCSARRHMPRSATGPELTNSYWENMRRWRTAFTKEHKVIASVPYEVRRHE